MAEGDCIPLKICTKCKSPKAFGEFYASKRFKDGRRIECKVCEKKRALDWRQSNPGLVKQNKRNWDAANKERVLEYARTYYRENVDAIRPKARAAAAVYRAENLEVVRERSRAYKAANLELNRANAREWGRKNPERNRARAKQWAESNNARFMARVTAYAKLHPGIGREQVRRMRAALAAAKVKWDDEFIISEIYDLARKRTEVTGFAWQVDHIVPIKSKLVCGLHVHWNLAVIPARINRRKSNRQWPDMP